MGHGAVSFSDVLVITLQVFGPVIGVNLMLVSRSLSLFAVDVAQARTSRRSPRSTYDPVSLPRRPCDARTWTTPTAKELRLHDSSGDNSGAAKAGPGERGLQLLARKWDHM